MLNLLEKNSGSVSAVSGEMDDRQCLIEAAFRFNAEIGRSCSIGRRDEKATAHGELEEVKKAAQALQKSSEVERELRCIKYELKKPKS
jgi:tRNA(Arg) A34 adenosine deaminase TadA